MTFMKFARAQMFKPEVRPFTWGIITCWVLLMPLGYANKEARHLCDMAPRKCSARAARKWGGHPRLDRERNRRLPRQCAVAVQSR